MAGDAGLAHGAAGLCNRATVCAARRWNRHNWPVHGITLQTMPAASTPLLHLRSAGTACTVWGAALEDLMPYLLETPGVLDALCCRAQRQHEDLAATIAVNRASAAAAEVAGGACGLDLPSLPPMAGGGMQPGEAAAAAPSVGAAAPDGSGAGSASLWTVSSAGVSADPSAAQLPAAAVAGAIGAAVVCGAAAASSGPADAGASAPNSELIVLLWLVVTFCLGCAEGLCCSSAPASPACMGPIRACTMHAEMRSPAALLCAHSLLNPPTHPSPAGEMDRLRTELVSKLEALTQEMQRALTAASLAQSVALRAAHAQGGHHRGGGASHRASSGGSPSLARRRHWSYGQLTTL